MSTQGQGKRMDTSETEVDAVREVLAEFSGDLHSTAMGKLGAEIVRLRTLLSSSRGEQGWRTIDSAPKDGTRFLAWGPLWRCPFPAQFPDPVTTMVWIDTCEVQAKGRREYATHWMPLPSAPGPVPTSLAGQVPDGYVLVPKEPTEEMIEAGNQACDMNCHLGGFEQGHVYRAMLSAAPQPTAGGDAPIFETPKSEPNLEPSNVFADALSAERARVIEECARVAETFHEDDDGIDRQVKRHVAAALRALGQQDTGGADHG